MHKHAGCNSACVFVLSGYMHHPNLEFGGASKHTRTPAHPRLRAWSIQEHERVSPEQQNKRLMSTAFELRWTVMQPSLVPTAGLAIWSRAWQSGVVLANRIATTEYHLSCPKTCLRSVVHLNWFRQACFYYMGQLRCSEILSHVHQADLRRFLLQPSLRHCEEHDTQ